MRQVCVNQRLFILAEPRSGSSWLMETLNSHSEIQLLGEIMNPVQNSAITKYIGGNENDFHDCLDSLERTLNAPVKKMVRFCGCKILLNQLTLIADDFPEFFLNYYNDAAFIFLYRTNLVAEQISLQIAHKYNIWHVTQENQVVLKKVKICPSVFVSKLEKSLWRRKKIWQLLNTRRLHYYPLSYEELFAERESIFEKIFAFLGVAATKVIFSSEIKGNPFQPQEVIENYQEVKSYLQQYPFFVTMLDNA